MVRSITESSHSVKRNPGSIVWSQIKSKVLVPVTFIAVLPAALMLWLCRKVENPPCTQRKEICVVSSQSVLEQAIVGVANSPRSQGQWWAKRLQGKENKGKFLQKACTQQHPLPFGGEQQPSTAENPATVLVNKWELMKACSKKYWMSQRKRRSGGGPETCNNIPEG